MNCISGSTCKMFMSATMLSQTRGISTSAKCLRTLGKLHIKTQETNLQKKKHIKYSDEFLMKQASRYKLSKRRLANMMGEDPDTYDDDDIKRSIKYLFPSDLDKKVLPSMDHPSKVFTTQLRIHWDDTGRPYHYLYYTKRPNLGHLLHQIYQYVLDAKELKKSGIRRSSEVMNENFQDITNDGKLEDTNKLDLKGTRWMTLKEVSSQILDGEIVTPLGYKQLIAQLERLLEEENAFIAKDFIMKLRKEVPIISMLDDIEEYEVLENGIKCAKGEGIKKSAVAKVKLFSPGTGKITVNNKPILRKFRFIADRQTLLAPFSLLGLLEKFDVQAWVEGGLNKSANISRKRGAVRSPFPSASQAVAIRLAIARSLRSFLTPLEIETMRRAGLLTQDKRWRERKVFGQHKARKKHTWKRR